MNRIAGFLSGILFTAAQIPLLLWPAVAESRIVRGFVVLFFGRLLAGHYHRVIRFYGAAYGAALAEALDRVAPLVGDEIGRVIDCGTGTGFVSRAVAERFPGARIIGLDAVLPMLRTARRNLRAAGIETSHVCADNVTIPILAGAADLVVAQNTAPFLGEFARVCRPGGAVVFVDSAARHLAPFARIAARRTGAFDRVIAEPAASGFFLVARARAYPGPAQLHGGSTPSSEKNVVKTLSS
jgi:SAM-dependent methyltransferase